MTIEKKEEYKGMEQAKDLEGYFAPSDIKPMLEKMGIVMTDDQIWLMLESMEKHTQCLPWEQLPGYCNPAIAKP